MIRHFTVTAFVSAAGRTLLHWHRKNQMWLPPGGHVEPNEDPIEAALREAEEETGFQVRLLPTTAPFLYEAPRQLPNPVSIMVEPIPATEAEAAHEHLDLIYFAQPASEGPSTLTAGWVWVARAELERNVPLTPSDGEDPLEIPEDARVLGIAAIDRAAEEEEG